jgi:NADH-ubiquinone oxidoreductase-F iron-sulfur binding region
MWQHSWDEVLLEELCRTIADASICGLGQAAPNPIRSVMKFFADDLRPAAPASRSATTTLRVGDVDKPSRRPSLLNLVDQLLHLRPHSVTEVV